MRILYKENDNLEIIEKPKDEIYDFIKQSDLRQKLNIHTKISVYKINSNLKNFSAETIKTLFEKSDKKQKNQMFSKIL